MRAENLHNERSGLTINESTPLYITESSGKVPCESSKLPAWNKEENSCELHNNCAQWIPTHLSSPYSVLSANGIRDDLYTKCLSWGVEHIALALRNHVLLFNPIEPQRGKATVTISDFDEEYYYEQLNTENNLHVPSLSLSSSSASSYIRPKLQQSKLPMSVHPTAIAISRFDDTALFIGLSNGNAKLYQTRHDGTFVCRQHFSVPTPSCEELSGFFTLPKSESVGLNERLCNVPFSNKYREAYSQLLMSMTSITSAETSDHHPFLSALSTSSCGLLILDSRQAHPCAVIQNTKEQLHSSLLSPLSLSTHSSSTLEKSLQHKSVSDINKKVKYNDDDDINESDNDNRSTHNKLGSCVKERISRSAHFIRCHDRLCSCSWNCNGSLVATGSGSGIVNIYSLSKPNEPLHSIPTSEDVTIKALTFHPRNAHELVFNANPYSIHSLCIYDISGNLPELTWASYVETNIKQVMYSPDGRYLITTHDDNTNKNINDGICNYDEEIALMQKRHDELLQISSSSDQEEQQEEEEEDKWYQNKEEEHYNQDQIEEEYQKESSQRGSIKDDGRKEWKNKSLFTNGLCKENLYSTHSSFAHTPYCTDYTMHAGVKHGNKFKYSLQTLRLNKKYDGEHCINHKNYRNNCNSIYKNMGNARAENKSTKLKRLIAQHAEQTRTLCSIQPYSLVVWKRGQHLHECRAQSELLNSVPSRAKLMYEHSVLSENTLSLSSSEQESLPRALLPQYAMSGHRVRPLLLTTSYKPPTEVCSYVSVAAGNDRTMRFWRVFELQHFDQRQKDVRKVNNNNSSTSTITKNLNSQCCHDDGLCDIETDNKFIVDDYSLR